MSSIVLRLSRPSRLALILALLSCVALGAFLTLGVGAAPGGAIAPSLLFLPFVFPIAIWAAWSDLARMKIPNKAVLSLLAVFLVTGAIALPLETYLWRWTHFAVILAIGFVLTLGGVFGAGDSKFAAAMAPFVALNDATMLIAIFGACVLVGFLSHRLARLVPMIRNATASWESWERMKDFPMGYPLAATLILYLGVTAT